MLERICHELCKTRVLQFAAAEDGIHSWRKGAKITHTDICTLCIITDENVT